MPKKKGDKGGNPNPVQTEAFTAKKFKSLGDVASGEKLAAKPRCVRYPEDLDNYLMGLESATVWLREAAREKYDRESKAEVELR